MAINSYYAPSFQKNMVPVAQILHNTEEQIIFKIEKSNEQISQGGLEIIENF